MWWLWVLIGVLWGTPHAFFLDTFLAQSSDGAQLHTMVILSMRAAAIIPLLSTTFVIAAIYPDAFGMVEIVQAVIEGYGIRCFYTLIAVSSAQRFPVAWLWQFVYLRPLLVALPFDSYYVLGLISLSSVIAVLGLVGVVWVTNSRQILLKFLVIKVLVFLIVAENAVRIYLYHQSHFTGGAKTVVLEGPNTSRSARYVVWLARVALLQLALLSSFFTCAFKPPMTPIVHLPQKDGDFSLTDFFKVFHTLPCEPSLWYHDEQRPLLAPHDKYNAIV